MNGGLMKAAGHGAIAVLAGLLMCTTSATAADLGGNCCADLEERVAELEATTARKGNRRVSLIISGQVNTAVMAWDQGADNAVFIVDNGVSRSGFNFDGSAKINPSLTAGFQVVIGLATGARSHQTSQANEGGATQTPGGDDGGANADGTLAIELANWYLNHTHYGRLTLGRINTASSGSTIVDLGGVGVIANANAQLWAGNFILTQDGVQSGTSHRWSSLMGGSSMGISSLSRNNAIRYDTPTMHGFSLSAAWGEQDAVDSGMWDVALRYAGEFSGFRVAAAVSYGVNVGGTSDAEDSVSTTTFPSFGDGADIRKWQGSASVLHVATGLFLSGAYANQSYNGTSAGEIDLNLGGNRPDTTFWYLLGGITRNWTGMGNTAFYGEYGRFDDGATGSMTGGGDSILSSEATFWGIGVVQNIDAAAMELFLSYRQFQAEVSSAAGAPWDVGGSLDELSVVMGGARIRF